MRQQKKILFLLQVAIVIACHGFVSQLMASSIFEEKNDGYTVFYSSPIPEDFFPQEAKFFTDKWPNLPIRYITNHTSEQQTFSKLMFDFGSLYNLQNKISTLQGPVTLDPYTCCLYLDSRQTIFDDVNIESVYVNGIFYAVRPGNIPASLKIQHIKLFKREGDPRISYFTPVAVLNLNAQ
jgi:hypothetical protein